MKRALRYLRYAFLAVLANYIWQALLPIADYSIALERSFYQVVAIATLFFFERGED